MIQNIITNKEYREITTKQIKNYYIFSKEHENLELLPI